MKKNIILPSVCLGFLAILALFGFGCHRREKPAESPKPVGTEKPIETAKPAETEASLEGRWVDVNGSTALEFRGDTMTVTFGSWTDEYRFQVKKTSYVTTITGDEGGFGVMSELTVQEDGSLRAYEMVLDAEGHTYHFVRPEALAEEKEIRDLSKDAPKEIASTELVGFSLGFRASRGSYGLDDRWPSGSYSWELQKQEDGGYRMDFRVMGDSYVALDFSEEVSADYAEGLAKLLADLGIPAYNGRHMANSVSKPGYSLYAEYASGEELSVRAEGDAGDECVFDLPALLEYAARQALFPDEN
jgi:hypothetical protein